MTISDIKNFVESDAPLKLRADGESAGQDLQVAAAALLINAAKVTSNFSKEELHKVLSSLFRAFHLEGEDASDVLAIAEAIMAKAGKMKEFTDALNNNFTSAQKEYLLSRIWGVLIADGLTERAEAAFAATLRHDLSLSIEQAVRARQMAELDGIPEDKQVEPAEEEAE